MWAISASLTRQMATSALPRPSCSRTRRKNNSRGGLATRTVRWRFRIILDEYRGSMKLRSSVNFFDLWRPGLGRARFRFAIHGIDGLAATLRLGTIILLIGADDLLYQVVAHDIFFCEVGDADLVDFAADFQRLNQPGFLARRQVDLRDVTGDDGLGIKAQAREKHLHLFTGGILRFVENDERVVERAAAHERQRRDLDDSLFEKAVQLVGFKHVVQRVVKRAHVRVDFLLQRAGKETETLAGFDGGTRENDAVDLLCQ